MTYTGYQVPSAPAAGPKKASPALPIVGALLLVTSVVVGLLLLTVMGNQSRSDRIKNFGRFLVEGGASADLDVKEADTYTIYYEYAGDVDGDEVDADSDPPDELQIIVTDRGDDDVRVRRPRDQLEFSSGGREGVAIGTIEFEDSGDYVIEATGGDEPFGISIGRGSLDEDLANSKNKLLGLLILIIGGLAGALLLVLGLARRGRGGGPPQPAYGQPQPGYQPQQPVYGAPPPGPYDPTGWGGPPTQPQPQQQPGGWPGQGTAGGWGAPPPPNQPGSPNPPFPGH